MTESELETPVPDDLVRCLACRAAYSDAEGRERGCPECGHATWIAAAIPLPAEAATSAAAARGVPA